MRSALKYLFPSAVLAGLAACTVVMQSDEVEPGGIGKCTSRLGAYQLATSRLEIAVTLETLGTNRVSTLTELKAAPRPDSGRIYCLDHLWSGTADDRVVVRRSVPADSSEAYVDQPLTEKAEEDAEAQAEQNVDTGLLQLIASRNVDTSALIARKAIRAGVALHVNGTARSLAGIADGRSSETALVDNPDYASDFGAFEIDPFNPVVMARVNERLRDFGYCVALEDYTIANASPFRLAQYCDAPTVTLRSAFPPKARDIVPRAPANNTQGVFYRPRKPYSVVVLANPDPNGVGDWSPVVIRTVYMENRSPVLSVGVDRAVFAARETALVFKDGALIDFCMAKGSGVEGAIEIPIELIGGILRSPVAAVQQATAVANQQRALAEAETKLIQVQEAAIALEAQRATDEQKNLLRELSTASESNPNPDPPKPGSPLRIDVSDLVSGSITTGVQQGDRLVELCPRLFAIADLPSPEASE